VTHDLRPVLEAVIFADDVTPGERMCAIEQLREMEGEHVCPRCASFEPPPTLTGSGSSRTISFRAWCRSSTRGARRPCR
jgi:hypothetical protein